ncbi:major facilitator superfamily domain-containing protein [Xylaria sp. CBS 124048]|nr:major facilitator superfamily domain-containing protein [Xylaria sp. CBS 124048]
MDTVQTATSPASSEKAAEAAVHLQSAPVDLRIDPELEKRVVRKIDLYLIPLVMSLYLVAFLDRSNIGNAQLAGMNRDLHLSDAQYQWLLTIFYIPYILFEWGALMWKAIPPHIWAFSCVFIWGIASTLQAATFSWSGMMAARFFLAAAEAGFAPGIPYLLSFFYKRHELGLRCGLFLSAAPLATSFAGALASAITSGHPSIANWRLLFIVEGIPTVIIACIAFFCLPDSADTAYFLTEEEKNVAKTRAMQQTGSEGTERIGHLDIKETLSAFKDPKTWIPPLMYFSCNVSFSSLPVFLPIILRDMGFTNIKAQGLSAPPYLLAFFVCIFTTWIADKTRQRGFMLIGLSLVGGAGYIILGTVKSVGVRYFAVFLSAAGVFSCIANILPWTINNQGSDSKRGASIALLNLIGQIGPILGTRVFPSSDAPFYVKGMVICAAFMFFNALLALLLRVYLARENKMFEKRDAESRPSDDVGKVITTEFENDGFGFRNVL